MRSRRPPSDPPHRTDVAVPASSANVFRREGEYWTIAYNGIIVRLRDTNGLHYLACLLHRPGAPFAARDLLAERQGEASAATTVPTADALRAVSERARLAVTKRLKDAVKRIAELHPALGYHLDGAVKTGASCVYRPDPERPIAWTR